MASCSAAKPCAGWRRSGHGTVIFTGASGSLRGRPRFAAFNATKGGLGLMVQSVAANSARRASMSRTRSSTAASRATVCCRACPTAPRKAGPDGLLNIDAIADSYWHLHRQHRSAWTHEIDLRPYKRSF